MPEVSERRRKPRKKLNPESESGWVTLESVPGSSNGVSAKVIDASEGGVALEVRQALEENIFIVMKSNSTSSLIPAKTRARVVRCWGVPGGVYNAALSFEETFANGKRPAPVEEVADYYEVLQVNPKADPDMIQRVYRLLAQRYHPDNKDTGNAEIFRSVLKAYQVLSDPEKRAAYDIQFQAYQKFRWQLFRPGDATVGKKAEISKRRGMLELLYTARLNQPAQPTMSLHDLEDLLGCPREHLEFSLWYLKENALIARTDSGRYSITAKGVDRAEQEDAEVQHRRLLTAAS